MAENLGTVVAGWASLVDGGFREHGEDAPQWPNYLYHGHFMHVTWPEGNKVSVSCRRTK